MARTEPRRVRPKFPKEWHVPSDPKHWITWAQAEKKLVEEQVYWVSTSSAEGKPHAAPVWGIWKGGRFYFETDPSSVKGRNLLGNPHVVLHLQDGMDTVIVEGSTARFRRATGLGILRKDYLAKYAYKPDWSDENRQVVFEVRPHIAHAWRAPRMHRTMVNFVF